MEQRIIFLDVDGTLAEPGGMTPWPSAQEALQRARAKGHRLVVCTGRNLGALPAPMKLPFDAVVTNAGGHIRRGEEIIFDCPLSLGEFRRVLGVLDGEGIVYSVECLVNYYHSRGFHELLLESARKGSNSELARWAKQSEGVDDRFGLDQYDGEPIYKFTFISPDPDRVQRIIPPLEADFECCIMGTDQFGVTNGELISRKFSKGAAVRTLCDYWGVPVSQSIAFGDSMNDASMLEAAGLGICMGNGDDRLKAVADEVCPPYDEDGILAAFLSHGLI